MSRGSVSSVIPFAVFLAILIIVLPAGAYNVALYGTNSGFDPDFHPGVVNVVRAIPGASGADLDTNINQFTDPSVDVIILAGEPTFSPSTAAKIEAAVAGGKILVLTYPCNRMFDQSLPATNGGTTQGGQYLEVSDPNSVVTRAIFARLPLKFDLQAGAAPDIEQAVVKPGTVTVLNYDTGMPALVYGKYGKGYIVQWTTVPVPSYMNDITADTIIHRMILGLLPEPVSTPTNAVTPIQTPTAVISVPVTPPVTATPVQPAVTPGTFGEVMVSSSPTGASILIDGTDFGATTPAKIMAPAGNHILQLKMNGFYDYEGSIYVVPGQTTLGYGTLQPRSQQTLTSAPTAIPTVVVPIIIATPTPLPTTEPKGILENSSVIVALIGVITAIIAAGASIFTHVKPPKKE